MFIPDPDPYFLPIPDPGSRGQKGTGFRIPDPDPQHCLGEESPPVVTLYHLPAKKERKLEQAQLFIFRIQELCEKSTDPVILKECPDIRWHFIGNCQSNKVRRILLRWHQEMMRCKNAFLHPGIPVHFLEISGGCRTGIPVPSVKLLFLYSKNVLILV
jgi:hypothetical protein